MMKKNWAELGDAKTTPIDASLLILTGVHLRWSHFLNQCKATDYKKSYFHPEHKKQQTLAKVICLYVWHGDHHLAHSKQYLANK